MSHSDQPDDPSSKLTTLPINVAPGEPGETSVDEANASDAKATNDREAAAKFSRKARHKARVALMQAIYQWQINNMPVTQLEAQFRANFRDAKVDLEFFHQVLNGVFEDLVALDQLYAPYLDRRVDELDPIERAILRLGSYELQHRLDIPYQVVINEGIELAKIYGAEESHRYVNGILDRLSQRLRRTEFESYRQRKSDRSKPKPLS